MAVEDHEIDLMRDSDDCTSNEYDTDCNFGLALITSLAIWKCVDIIIWLISHIKIV